jgi:hypothetical protein
MPRVVQRAYVATYRYYRHQDWSHGDAFNEARMPLAWPAAVALFFAPLLPVRFGSNVLHGGIDLRAHQTAEVYVLAVIGLFDVIHAVRKRLGADRLPPLAADDFDAACIAAGRSAYWRLAGLYVAALMSWTLGAMVLQLVAWRAASSTERSTNSDAAPPAAFGAATGFLGRRTVGRWHDWRVSRKAELARLGYYVKRINTPLGRWQAE